MENNGCVYGANMSNRGEGWIELVNRGTMCSVTIQAQGGVDAYLYNEGLIDELRTDSADENTMFFGNSGLVRELLTSSAGGSTNRVVNDGTIESACYTVSDRSVTEVQNNGQINYRCDIDLMQNESDEIGSFSISGNGRLDVGFCVTANYHVAADKDVSTPEKQRELMNLFLDRMSVDSDLCTTLPVPLCAIVGLRKNLEGLSVNERGVGADTVYFDLSPAADQYDPGALASATRLSLEDQLSRLRDGYTAAEAQMGLRMREKEAAQNEIERKVRRLGSLRPGDIVVMGEYDQDHTPENGLEPIEWIVTSIEGDHAILISRYGLDVHRFSGSPTIDQWPGSALFAWLNKELIRQAFSADELFAIKYAQRHRSEEYLYLMTKQEVEQAFPDELSRRTAATPAAIAHGAKQGESGSCAWLTFSNGDYSASKWFYVRPDGTFGETKTENLSIAIRPCLRLYLRNIRKVRDVYRPEAPEQKEEEACPPMFETGATVTFGRYEQDNKTGNGPEPIEWTVLTHRDGKALLTSRMGLDTRPYHDKEVSVTWETCSLRSWLNREFFDAAFDETQKQAIELSDIVTNAGSNTQDRVFILSADEATEYLQDEQARRVGSTSYARKRGAYDDGNNNAYWWTRTRDEHESGVLLFAVQAIEGPKAFGSPVTWYYRYLDYPVNTDRVTVRPAVWVDMSSPCFTQAAAATPSSEAVQAGAAPADGDQVTGRVRIKGNGMVNVREESNTDSKILDRVKTGSTYDYVAVASNGWVQIILENGQKGFVSGKMVDILQ